MRGGEWSSHASKSSSNNRRTELIIKPQERYNITINY
jgi:hypothetical protein